MAKPICVVYAQQSYGYTIHTLQDALSNAFPDYHVLVLPADDNRDEEGIRIDRVFYEKDFTEVDYEAFKKYIEKELTIYKAQRDAKTEIGY